MKEERMNLYRQSIIVGALKGDELDMRAMLGMDLAYFNTPHLSTTEVAF